MPEDNTVRTPGDTDLNEILTRLRRDGLAIVSITQADRDDPNSDFLIRVMRRTEYRG